MKTKTKLFAMVALFATVLFASCKKEETKTPVVDFSFTSKYNTSKVDTFYYGDTLTINNLTTDGETYLWSFGDGTTSTEKNPRKVYIHTPSQGEFVSFPVTLTATNNGKSASKTKTIVQWWD